MFKITSAAEKYLYYLLSFKKNKQIRIRILINENNSFTGNVYFCDKKEIKDTDFEIKLKNFSIFIKKNNLKLLQKLKLDLINDNLSKKLLFTITQNNINKNNKNLIFLKEKITLFLKEKINPKLLNHGGYVILKKITLDYLLMLEFYGGCRGCSMINNTFKYWIEKELLNNFSEVKGILDVTKHDINKFSYY
ncbi:hypothetical protein GJT81_01180 [Enterobacteriaceae endosymbiont of Plateumaris consimilis]|uniref:NifU family protein n=1 Tax=Enterobacteriaceae endosymbiont of Plateumaris consimilis TaxID=2675794 RepID=UPI001448BD99|nr:NifU family protein [Enterobacteriaceae endosymbiont of Plateumaris consimilis]QJC28632.1 hypothetical protein GJT81_01180 [Enterobacteriaceae endosymbiont of Plateumaris consimilis]